MPELSSYYPGDQIDLANFPSLKHLMHTGHKTIRGTTKFKENMFYAKKAFTNYRIAGSSPDALALECYRNGSQVTSFSNSDLVSQAESLLNNHLSSADSAHPIFMTLNTSYPLGLAAILGSAIGQKKIFHPATYNLKDIMHSFDT